MPYPKEASPSRLLPPVEPPGPMSFELIDLWFGGHAGAHASYLTGCQCLGSG
jgi:hypothetical protein